MLRKLSLIALLLALVAPAVAQQKASTTEELTALLHHFLDAAGRNDKAVFDRFWAEDVLYTGSSGRHVTKADIMKSLDEPAKPGEPQSTFDADQITVHDYGDFAVVAFRLIQNVVNKDGTKETHYYRNTGTFQKREGRWQAVAWQATKLPEEQPKAGKTGYVPPNGFVPDAATAIRIAEAVWTPIYGGKQLATEHPFEAKLLGDVWLVKGSLPGGWEGGVAEAHIARTDGRVLEVSHGK